MPQPITVKLEKIDVPAPAFKAPAEKAATGAAKQAAARIKLDKKYDVKLSVKVKFDKNDKPAVIEATCSFDVAIDGRMQPQFGVTKSGVAKADRFGSQVAEGVGRAVESIVDSVIGKLVKTLEQVEEAEKDKEKKKGK
jgi:hypothetical protein